VIPISSALAPRKARRHEHAIRARGTGGCDQSSGLRPAFDGGAGTIPQVALQQQPRSSPWLRVSA